MDNNVEIPRKVIMVVDDDETIRSFIRFSLEQEGFEVIEQRSGQGALNVLERRKPDLILLDIMMPGMDGFEVIKAIRKKRQFDTVPVIFITAHMDPDSPQKAKSLGAQGFMEKPLRFNELLRQIFDALNGQFSVPTRVKYSE